MAKTTFIIADPSFLIRKGLKTLIHKLENTEVLHEIDNKEDFMEMIKHEKPDILIVNPIFLNISLTNPMEAYQNGSDIKIVLLSNNEKEESNFECEGQIHYMDPQNKILNQLKEIRHSIDEKNSDEKESNTLSSREKNILQHIAQGLTNKEIADKLFISIHTVVTHRKHITRKLGIKSVSGLTVYAILNNLVSMDEIK